MSACPQTTWNLASFKTAWPARSKAGAAASATQADAQLLVIGIETNNPRIHIVSMSSPFPFHVICHELKRQCFYQLARTCLDRWKVESLDPASANVQKVHSLSKHILTLEGNGCRSPDIPRKCCDRIGLNPRIQRVSSFVTFLFRSLHHFPWSPHTSVKLLSWLTDEDKSACCRL